MCLHQACSKSPRWSLQYFPTWNAIFLVPWGSLGHVPAHTPVKPSSFGISSASSIVFSCCCRDKTPCRINIMARGVKGCHPPCSEGVTCMSWEEHMTWLLLPHTDQEVESQTLSRSGSGSKVLPLLVFRRQILNLPKQLHLLGTEHSKHKPAGTFQLQHVPLTSHWVCWCCLPNYPWSLTTLRVSDPCAHWMSQLPSFLLSPSLTDRWSHQHPISLLHSPRRPGHNPF